MVPDTGGTSRNKTTRSRSHAVYLGEGVKKINKQENCQTVTRAVHTVKISLWDGKGLGGQEKTHLSQDLNPLCATSILKTTRNPQCQGQEMEHCTQREERMQRTYVRSKEQKESHPVALGMKPVGKGRGEARRVGRTARARPCAQGPGSRVFLRAALEGFKQESNKA